MTQRVSASTAALLVVPPLLWAGNAVVGRMAGEWISPVLLNFARWSIAFLLLVPMAPWVLRRDSGLWRNKGRYALLGLLGIGLYNALQYLALQTSTPINVTLVASCSPIMIMAVGSLAFGQKASRRQAVGALLSVAGVAVVLCRGEWEALARLRLVVGDLYVLLATLGWAFYSWLLARTTEPAAICKDWAALLLGQLLFGVGFAGLFAGGEWVAGASYAMPGWPLVFTIAFVAIGPGIIAYRCWGLGVQRAGPSVAGFFSNLAPLFAAVLSTLLLGEAPRPYHGLAFVLIVAGIVVASQPPSAAAPQKVPG